MSNITSCDSGSFSTENTREDAAAVKHQPEMLPQFHSPHSLTSTTTTTNNTNASNTISQPPPPVKKKRSLPGNPGMNFFNTHLTNKVYSFSVPLTSIFIILSFLLLLLLLSQLY